MKQREACLQPWSCNQVVFNLCAGDLRPLFSNGFIGEIHKHYNDHAGNCAAIANSAISKMIDTVQDEADENN